MNPIDPSSINPSSTHLSVGGHPGSPPVHARTASDPLVRTPSPELGKAATKPRSQSETNPPGVKALGKFQKLAVFLGFKRGVSPDKGDVDVDRQFDQILRLPSFTNFEDVLGKELNDELEGK